MGFVFKDWYHDYEWIEICWWVSWLYWKMPIIEGNRPETLHNMETAVHETFLLSLAYCKAETNSYDTLDFMQCIKAAGVNFTYSYDQFYNYKNRRQQASNSGHIDWFDSTIHNTQYTTSSIRHHLHPLNSKGYSSDFHPFFCNTSICSNVPKALAILYYGQTLIKKTSIMRFCLQFSGRYSGPFLLLSWSRSQVTRVDELTASVSNFQ